MPFKPGQSGNPGGRPKLAKVIVAAGFKPGELRSEIVQLAVATVRDPGADGSSWRYAHDYLAGILGIRAPKELIVEDERDDATFDETLLTDEQLEQAIGAIDKLKELAVVGPDESSTEH